MIRGKILREDFGKGRGREDGWPAIPEGLSLNASICYSTTVICARCQSPYGGLCYNDTIDVFEHRDPTDCLAYA